MIPIIYSEKSSFVRVEETAKLTSNMANRIDWQLFRLPEKKVCFGCTTDMWFNSLRISVAEIKRACDLFLISFILNMLRIVVMKRFAPGMSRYLQALSAGLIQHLWHKRAHYLKCHSFMEIYRCVTSMAHHLIKNHLGFPEVYGKI